MTLAEFQPHVEQALIALEWATARARWRAGLEVEQIAIRRALDFAGQYGVEPEPLEVRLLQIGQELGGDVTADCVPQHPVRSIPMDLITAAVVRRILGLPSQFPVLTIKQLPAAGDIQQAIAAIARKWQTPYGQTPAEEVA